VYEAESFLRS